MEDIVERTLNFNQSLTDAQRLELVSILTQIIKDGDAYIIPGVFLITSNPPTEEDILKAEILAQNKKDCEQFRNPNPDGGGGIIPPMSEAEISKWAEDVLPRLAKSKDLTLEETVVN